MTAPIFLLVPQVKLPKRLNLDRDAERALDSVPHYFDVLSFRVIVEERDKEMVSEAVVKVKVDGEIAFEDWTWHAPRRGDAEIDLGRGEHRFEIEYFQIDGATALGVELVRP